MIKRLEIQGVHFEVDDRLRKYVTKKIGGLDKYLPRYARKSAHAEVYIKAESKGAQKYTAEVMIHLPHETINVKESTLNAFAAIDVVEEKAKNQLKKYKELNAHHRLLRRVKARLRGSGIV